MKVAEKKAPKEMSGVLDGIKAEVESLYLLATDPTAKAKACVDAIDDALEMVESLSDTLTEKITGLQKEVADLKDEVEEMEGNIAELEAEKAGFSGNVNTQLGELNWTTSNLLDQQVMEALGECIGKINPHELLASLNAMAGPYKFKG